MANCPFMKSGKTLKANQTEKNITYDNRSGIKHNFAGQSFIMNYINYANNDIENAILQNLITLMVCSHIITISLFRLPNLNLWNHPEIS